MDSNQFQERLDAKKAMDKAEKAMEEAEKAMEEAKGAYKEAKEAFTEDWKTNNPNGSKADLFRYLKEELKEYSAAVESCKEIYKKLVETYEKFVEKMPTQDFFAPEGRITKKARRDASIKSTVTTGSGMSQNAFRKRVVERDGKCLISETEADDCQACHIIPKRIFEKNEIPERKIWDERFPYGCVEPHHRVMDVRNGILLAFSIHVAFDMLDLTIVKTSSHKYKVVTNELSNLSAKIINYNGKEIQFNPEKQNEWPCDDFLKFHNECYETKKNMMEAAAEPVENEEENSAQTLAERGFSASKVEWWFETGLQGSL
jgi:hypothetical protein